MSLLDELGALPAPEHSDGLSLGVSLCAGSRVAKTHGGSVAVAIAVAKTGTSARRQLENLTYLPPRTLQVSGPEGTRQEELALLTCRSTDPALQGAFLRIARATLEAPPAGLTEHELDARIDELVRLFRALGKPATQTVQGLWGELAVIAWSADPRRAVVHWHSSARAQHDFDGGADRLEVKSCARELREHAVRLEQLRWMPSGHTLFASVILDEDGQGASVSDLVESIMTSVDEDIEVRRRLQAIIIQSLGSDWRDADTRRFSLSKARDKLRFYEASTIPTVLPPPAGVRQVSFVVDLTNTAPTELAEARSWSDFFYAMLPSEG